MILERALKTCAALVGALVAVATLGSCGSGAVADNTPPPTPGPVAVLPTSATVYSGVPTTFVVSGGSGTFSVVSSNQNVIPNSFSQSGSSFIVVASDVGADTPVTLTVLDASGTQTSASVTVKPRTVASTITITPTSSQSAICGAAICSGGDAEVSATLSLAGASLANRQVRFEAISGEFRFITSQVGAPETLDTSVTTVTDSTGTARVRLRVLPEAGPQTALLQITDVVSGAFQRASFTIAVANTALLAAQPSTINFRGLTSASCAQNISADVIVVGGRPPYQVSNPGSFFISPTIVNSSGGRFTVTATGQCASGAQVAVVDQLGASAIVTVNNVEGPGVPSTNGLTVAPLSVALGTKCTSTASVLVAGGVGSYFGVTSDPYLILSISGNTVTISRSDPVGSASPTGPRPATSPIPISISDGREVVSVSVSLPTGACTP